MFKLSKCNYSTSPALPAWLFLQLLPNHQLKLKYRLCLVMTKIRQFENKEKLQIILLSGK